MYSFRFLQYIIGFDSVDDESKPENPMFDVDVPTPDQVCNFLTPISPKWCNLGFSIKETKWTKDLKNISSSKGLKLRDKKIKGMKSKGPTKGLN